jgi:colicin import membrane protein
LSPIALGLAIALHAILFGIMFIKVDSHVKPVTPVVPLQVTPEKSPDIVEATAVDNQELEKRQEKILEIEREKKRKIEAEKRRKAELERKKEAEAKRKKELALKKKKEEEQRKKKLAEEKKRKEAERKKKLAEEKKRKEEERRKKLEAEKKRKAEEARKRKAEAERKRREAEMKQRMEAEARARRAGQAMSQYIPRIMRKVSDNWSYPPRGPEGCNPTVRVNLAPDGRVLAAKISKSSGDPFCDSSVEKAFLKASPIPIPPDPDLYSEFKVIDFLFRP